MRKLLERNELKQIYEFIRDTLEREILLNQMYGMGGFCNRIQNALNLLGISDINPFSMDEFQYHFGELYAYKPAKTGAYWFKVDDHETRLKIIQQVLKEF